MPFEPLIIDEHNDQTHVGRINRLSLPPIWTWLKRDLSPDRFDDILQLAEVQSVAGDKDSLKATVKELRKQFAMHARAYMSEIEDKFGTLNKVALQLGGFHVLQDLKDILEIIDFEDVFVKALEGIPSSIMPGQHAMETMETIVSRCRFLPVNKMLYVAAAILAHSNASIDLIRFAKKQAGSARGPDIRKKNSAAFVTIILSEVERLQNSMAYYLKKQRDINRALTCLDQYYQIYRMMQTELELQSNDPWAQKLASFRVEFSDILQPEIASSANLVKRTLRQNKSEQNEYAPSTSQISDAVCSVRILVACKKAHSALALNTIIGDNFKKVENMIDTLSEIALEDLDNATPQTFHARNMRTQAAITLAGYVFGGDYTRLMKKKYQIIADNRPDLFSKEARQFA
jgi:hypothetical protein